MYNDKHYYNIEINKKVHNFNEGFVLLIDEIKRLHTWERSFVVEALLERGFSVAQAAHLLHINRKQLYALGFRNSKTSSGSPSQADGSDRPACVPPEEVAELKSKSNRKEN